MGDSVTDTEFIDDMRTYRLDHLPDGWPAVRTAQIDRLIEIIDRQMAEYREIVQLAVDAEIITRSRCKELIGMSHPEIGKLFANSPIGRETAARCAEIAYNTEPPKSIGQQMGRHHSAGAQHAAKRIREQFNLSD